MKLFNCSVFLHDVKVCLISSHSKVSTYLLKTELRISDFEHFHWLTGHRLSVHIPAVPNMVKESVSNKASGKHFCSSEKNCLTKAV